MATIPRLQSITLRAAKRNRITFGIMDIERDIIDRERERVGRTLARIKNRAFSFQSVHSSIQSMLEIGTGYSWDIRGIFVGCSRSIRGIYVCIGSVSGMYRVCIGNTQKETGCETECEKVQKKSQNIVKHLVMSVNFSTFAGGSDLHYQNYRRLYKIVKN